MSGFMNPREFANIAQAEKDLWWYRGMRRILFRMLEPFVAGRTVGRALEAGCGTGYLSHLMQQELHWPVVPLDISGEGLRYAREMGTENPVQGDISRLPFADRSFDLVISMDVLVHVPRGEEHLAARELARVLARGGLIVLRVAALDVLRSRHSKFIAERQRFTRRRLMRLVAGTGVRVLRCTYVNSLLLPVALAKFRVWEPLLRRPPASGVEPSTPWLDSLLYAPLALEAAWVGSGRNLPVGQSLLLIGEKIL
ncbi:Methyltransferase type 11 [Candidatus Sulfopaludibacter sp. SbA4]|nr:Methyltransferase type 11 [Candidatus Sulfopaludibacter sp. SbA4]